MRNVDSPRMGWVAQASNGSDSVPLEAVAITAGAVVVGAIIAAVAAHLRLQATLKAERVRLDDQLEAERARLDQQLEHDRELTDLAELRTLLDGVMADAFAAFDSYSDLVHNYENELAQPPPADPQAEEERRLKRRDAIGPAAQALLRVSVDGLRVSARSSQDHAVVNALRDMREAIVRGPALDSPASPEIVEAHQASLEKLQDAQPNLIIACRATIGSRIRNERASAA
jgi:uncharacterized membrane-anchored protein YhcB (DUF1043 family)